MSEIFIAIIGYEGLYEVGDRGNIKSLARKHVHTTGYEQHYPERILKTEKTYKGYQRVMLANSGHYKKFYVHRLVAMHFIINMHGKPQVNHMNSRKYDNRAKNLEWVTLQENVDHYVRAKKNRP